MTTTLQDLKPGQIKPHKHNPRRDVGDVTELADSIRAQGIVEPLIVAPNGTGSTFVLLAGHRRLAAAKAARLKVVPCLVRDDLEGEQQQLETMLVENLQRTDLSPIEEAEAYQQLLEFPGYTQKQLAETTGRAARTITARLKLAKLSERSRKRLHGGQLSLADATMLSEFVDDPDTLATLEDKVGSYDFAWQLENARRRRQTRKADEAAARKLAKDGVQVVTDEQLRDIDEQGDDESDLEPWVYVVDPAGENYDIGDLPMAPADHQSCPGHAAVVHSGEAHFVCTQPAQHRDLFEQRPDGSVDTAEQRADRAQREAEQQAREQLEADLQVAAKVRRAHLATRLEDVGSFEGADILRDAILAQMHGVRTGSVLADILLPKRTNDEALTERLRDALASERSLERLAVLLDIAGHANEDDDLARGSYGWPAGGNEWVTKRTEAWRARLVDVYGYEWSDVERRLLEQPSTDD